MPVPSRAIFDGESPSPGNSEDNKLTRVASRTNRIVAEVPSGKATATGFVALVLPMLPAQHTISHLRKESHTALRISLHSIVMSVITVTPASKPLRQGVSSVTVTVTIA